MSYCRWSSTCENGKESDVYVYADVSGGYTTHVANRKRIGKCDVDCYNEVDCEHLVPIDLPMAGESFNDDTAAEAADRLEALRTVGYEVPQYAINDLRSEDAD